jgi:hypothetical protein
VALLAHAHPASRAANRAEATDVLNAVSLPLSHPLLVVHRHHDLGPIGTLRVTELHQRSKLCGSHRHHRREDDSRTIARFQRCRSSPRALRGRVVATKGRAVYQVACAALQRRVVREGPRG